MPAGPDLDISRPQQYAATVAGAALPNPQCQPNLDLLLPRLLLLLLLLLLWLQLPILLLLLRPPLLMLLLLLVPCD